MHVPLEKCPKCGMEFSIVEECTPVSDGKIETCVESIMREGCPECGSRLAALI